MIAARSGVVTDVRIGSVGEIADPLGGVLRTGFLKRPVMRASVVAGGLVGDESEIRPADDLEQAVCAYPSAHFAWWRDLYGQVDARFTSGAFGENLTVQGLTERDVCIGDAWRIGSAVLVVSKPRYPCRKLDVVHRQPGLARRVRESLRTGWYMRVAEPGEIERGDRCDLIHRPHVELTVHDVALARFSPAHTPRLLEAIGSCPALASDWRQAFLARAGRRAAHAGVDEPVAQRDER